MNFHSYAQLSVGTSAGLTRVKLGGDKPPGASYLTRTGFCGSGIVDLKLSPEVTLSFQPSYSLKGTKIAYEVRGEVDPVDSIDVKLTYFSFPVLVKVFTWNPRWYVSGGLEASYLIESKYHTTSGDQEITSGLYDLDLAINFGVGFLMKMGPPKFFMELRYCQSFTNLVKEDFNSEFLKPRLKNNGFLLLLGVLFR